MPDDVLNEMAKVGKKISIQIKITDSKKAIELMGTMYPKEGKKNNFGVEVYSWGAFDLVQAYQAREEEINVEMERHIENIKQILGKSLYSYVNK